MNLKISYGLFAGLLLSSTSYADTDYACQSDCLNRGYMLQYCQEACSYGANAEATGGIDTSHGVVGAVMSMQQQQLRNQQQELQNQQRQLEIERMQLENARLRQEVSERSVPAPAPDYKPVADSSAKSSMPQNAEPDQYAVQGWSCKAGFTQVGKSCVSE